MSRYIDIEPYERKPGGGVTEYSCRVNMVSKNGFGTVRENRIDTKDIPTADVERIRYGEWQQDENGDFVCSECMGALSDIFDVMHAYVRDVDIERVEICPFCGARMCVRVDEKQKREEAAE